MYFNSQKCLHPSINMALSSPRSPAHKWSLIWKIRSQHSNTQHSRLSRVCTIYFTAFSGVLCRPAVRIKSLYLWELYNKYLDYQFHSIGVLCKVWTIHFTAFSGVLCPAIRDETNVMCCWEYTPVNTIIPKKINNYTQRRNIPLHFQNTQKRFLLIPEILMFLNFYVTILFTVVSIN